ncbi:MAG: hypothetical protein KDI68_16040 [Gammaproteobacteria bacterium]|nr:hypothetical protein [Gammaproteobacteria bacterium]
MPEQVTIEMRSLQLFICLMLMLSSVASAAETPEGCLRQVFGGYCLGGDIRELARRNAGFMHQQREGERFALIYPAGRDKDYVMAHRNRIYKVLRKYEPSTNISYRDLRQLLTGKYGEPVDQSRFPLHAKGLAAKIGAIRRGEGKMLLYWYPADMPWHIELGWSREMGLNLAYLDSEEQARQRLEDSSNY